MEYNKLISVTGLPGLYELVNSKNDGALVRSLEDKSTRFVSSRLHNFSHLESIEVYTEDDNVNLVDVFTAMLSSAEKTPDEKDAAAVKKYFEKVFPSMDMSRVYHSDMKKMIRWFSILQKNNIEIKLSESPAEDAAEETPVASHEHAATEKPAKKAARTKEKEDEKDSAEGAPKAKKLAAKGKKD